jgi:hypothetical protein
MTFARCWIGLVTTTACSATGRELAPASEWEVSAAPGATIGVLEGTAPHELHRVTAAVRTRDGRIIVANSGSRSSRMTDCSFGSCRSTAAHFRGTTGCAPAPG